MYFVIAGAGEVGYHIAKSLLSEGHEIAIIEKDQEACAHAETLDALVIRGNAASAEKLEEAYIKNADAFVAVTGSDEINIVACGIAKSKKCRTIARVNNLDYVNEPVDSKSLVHIGVDIAICPELVAAIKLSNLLTTASIIDVDIFAGGKVRLTDSKVGKRSIALRKRLRDIKFPPQCNVVAILRGSDITIPHGDDVILPNDRVITVVGDPSSVPKVGHIFGANDQSAPLKIVERVMIAGATRIGIHLARLLTEKDVKVVLVEEDEEKAAYASELLSDALIIHGEYTDRDVLLDEGVAESDAFIAASRKEEMNILSCLLAKQLGAPRSIAMVDRPDLKTVLEDIGVDVAITSRIATISSVLQHIRKTKLLSLSVLQAGEAQVLEVKVTSESRIVGKRLKAIKWTKHALVGAVVRGKKVIIPRGDFRILEDDVLIIFVKTAGIKKIEKLF